MRIAPNTMVKFITISLLLFTYFNLLACGSVKTEANAEVVESEIVLNESTSGEIAAVDGPIVMGAERFGDYASLLQSKNVALVVNQTSVVNGMHLVDFFLEQDVAIVQIFAPEHGFRGKAAAGEQIKDQRDKKTGLPITSLYGKKKKPLPEDLANIDVIVFDIQDVGVRFYTYLSSLHYVMEAAAENGVEVVVLDRPNPNGNLVDGPVLDLDFQSFVGMHEIPVGHGMTLGEMAQMIRGEKWIKKSEELKLTVIPCENYSRDNLYNPPIPPSPNLATINAIYCYPSLCFFEGTVVSCGRGTWNPFTKYGYPGFEDGTEKLAPQKSDAAKWPKFENKEVDFKSLLPASNVRVGQDYLKRDHIDWSHLWVTYATYPDKSSFFLENKFIDKLAGTDALRNALLEGWTIEKWVASYQEGLNKFKVDRKPYLIYPE